MYQIIRPPCHGKKFGLFFRLSNTSFLSIRTEVHPMYECVREFDLETIYIRQKLSIDTYVVTKDHLRISPINTFMVSTNIVLFVYKNYKKQVQLLFLTFFNGQVYSMFRQHSNLSNSTRVTSDVMQLTLMLIICSPNSALAMVLLGL